MIGKGTGGVWKTKGHRYRARTSAPTRTPTSSMVRVSSAQGAPIAATANAGIRSTHQIPHYVIDIMFRLRILFSR
jgi:hypothetical protein